MQNERHIHMDPETIGGILQADTSRDGSAPISALRGVAFVTQAGHQLRPDFRNPLHIPSRARGLIRKSITWQGRTDYMECVGGVAAMPSRVREWLDNLLKLDDRAGPAMSHDQ